MNAETLTPVTTPVTALRIGHKVWEVDSDSWKIQEHLNYRSSRTCYCHEIVGTVCVAVSIPKKRVADPNRRKGRLILDNEKAAERLARAVAREKLRQARLAQALARILKGLIS